MDDWVMGALAAQDQYQPAPADVWAREDAKKLPDVGPPLIPSGPQIFEGTELGKKLALGASRWPGAVASNIAHIPERMIHESQKATTNGLDNSNYDPAPAVDFMATMYGTGTPFAKAGTAGAFGGRLSQTADHAALAKAEDMLANGADAELVRRSTGWRKDIDGQWKYEMSDVDTRVIPEGLEKARTQPMPLSEVFHWPEVYKAYPEMKNTQFLYAEDPMMPHAEGTFMPGRGDTPPTIQVKPGPLYDTHATVLHEGTHGIQEIENFATGKGGGSNAFRIVPGDPAWDIYRDVRKSFREGTTTDIPVIEKNREAILSHPPEKQEEFIQRLAKLEAYRRQAGEAEARNVPNRRLLTPEQIREIPPSQTLDVPYDKQSVFYPRPPSVAAAKAAEESPTILPAEGSRMGDVAATGNIASPSILTRREPTSDDIAAVKASAARLGRSGWPDATREIFPATPEAYGETTKLVPQVSVKSQLPGPLQGEKLPNNERTASIVANRNQIAANIAERLDPLVRADSPLLKFYHTGPVIRGLEQYGDRSIAEAAQFMRDWSGQGAATSPRTQTPPNLRNSSFLLHERASGNPMTPERYATEGNQPGFGMMGMHVDLADKFHRGTINPWTNPKPFTFRENWSGNLRDITADTHNIRGTLYEADRLHPGQLPREFFTSDEAFAKYRRDGFESLDPGAIKDSLGSTTVRGVKRQSEYLPMAEPWYLASDMLKVHPAEAQSGGWFSYGGITGLQSPPKTITNLLNDQISATAKELRVPEETVVNWWSKGKIPLTAIGGAALLAPEVMRGRNNDR